MKKLSFLQNFPLLYIQGCLHIYTIYILYKVYYKYKYIDPYVYKKESNINIR